MASYFKSFTIVTVEPNIEDTLLVVDKPCPNVDEKYDKITKSLPYRQFVDDHVDLFNNLSLVGGTNILTVDDAWEAYQTFAIELDHGFWWDKVWSREKQQAIVDQLKQVSEFHYSTLFNDTLIQKVRSGNLIEELYTNMIHAINGTSTTKFYVYSGHDKTLASLMSLLGIFNNQLVPFGSVLFFELHEINQSHIIRIYYFNETFENKRYLIKQNKCDGNTNCSLEQFHSIVEPFIIEDFNSDCGITEPDDENSLNLFLIVIFALIGAVIGMLCSCLYFCISNKSKIARENKEAKQKLNTSQHKTYYT